MTAYRDVTLEASGLFETCARHTARHTARTLQTIYLCDDCTQRLVHEAFNDRAPVHHGETIQGYCGLCSIRRDVTMRQWFVCGTCWNVVLAYQKSIAATAGVHSWWNKTIASAFAHLRLEETEPMYLSPYARSAKTKKQGAAMLSILDFLVSDLGTTPGTPLFHIEQKTGPGSIQEMSEFQLDVNDYNDIAGAMNNTHFPAYVVHVQIAQEYTFPTRRTVVRGLWWTDLFNLAAHRIRVGTRRGEDKEAIYFAPSAFKAIDTFPDELARENHKVLAAKLAQNPVQLV